MKKAILGRLLPLLGAVTLICFLLAAGFFQYQNEKELSHRLAVRAGAAVSWAEGDPLPESQWGEMIFLCGREDVLTDVPADADTKQRILKLAESCREDFLNELPVVRVFSEGMDRVHCVMFPVSSDRILMIAGRGGGYLRTLFSLFPFFLLAEAAALLGGWAVCLGLCRSFNQPLLRMQERIDSGQIGELSAEGQKYPELRSITVSIKKLFSLMEGREREISLERRRIDYILSSMEEGFVMLDEEGGILILNESARDIFRLKRIPPDLSGLTSEKSILRAAEKALGKGSSSLFDYEAPDGRILSVHVSPVQSSYDEVIDRGVTILLVDVTVDRQARRMRQEFFSNASHELKTPITSIRGFAELLRTDLVTDEEKRSRLFARIEAESQRMTELINDILMISRLEAGKEREERVDVDLSQVASEAAEAVAPQAEAGGVTVNLRADDSIRLRADRRQMYELCINLIENAVKYNRPGGTVDITLERVEGENALKFIVQDTGLGIPAECQPRIFERFYRVDTGRARGVGGTGLGLSIVKHIAADYGGEISLRSREGKGTRIAVRLPFPEEESSAQ